MAVNDSPILGPHLGVEIEVAQNDHTVRYNSRFVDADSRLIYLQRPFENGLPVILRRGQSVTVYLKDEGKLWYFDTRVQRVQASPRPIVAVRRPAGLEEQRRRQYARESLRITPKYFTLLDRHRDRGYPLQVTIINISGGGLLFTSSQQVPEGEIVKMALELPHGFGEIRAVGKVVNSRPAPQHGRGLYAMGVSFT